jgi:hypothetical protein
LKTEFLAVCAANFGKVTFGEKSGGRLKFFIGRREFISRREPLKAAFIQLKKQEVVFCPKENADIEASRPAGLCASG